MVGGSIAPPLVTQTKSVARCAPGLGGRGVRPRLREFEGTAVAEMNHRSTPPPESEPEKSPPAACAGAPLPIVTGYPLAFIVPSAWTT